MDTLALVACAKTKRAVPAPAEELYVSPWFKKARRYARREAGRWLILSAEHGLLAPHEIVAPYETCLHDFTKAERRAWADHVWEQLRNEIRSESHVVVLAGTCYREHLVSRIKAQAASIAIPMKGLGIGQQLAFLSQTAI